MSSPPVTPPLSSLPPKGNTSTPVPYSSRLLSCQPACHPVVESAHKPPNPRCRHPHLLPKQQNRLNHHHITSPWCPGIHTLPFQHPWHPSPLLLRLPKILHYRWSFIIRLREDSPKVLEVGDWGKGVPIGCYRRRCPLFHFLLRQASPLPIFPIPCFKRQSQGSGRWVPCETQTCCTWGTGDKVGYPPPGSQLCSAHGGAQSKPRGWSGLKFHPGTPIPGTGAATDVLVKIPGKFGRGGLPPPWSPLLTLFWIWSYVNSDLVTTSTPHSGHFTHLRCCSQNASPFPIVCLSCASTNILTGASHI